MDTSKEISKEVPSDSTTKKSKLLAALRVDTYMLPAKITYFFITGKEGTISPYIMSFLIGIGLTPAEAGLISGVRLIGMILGGPFWGYLGDKHQNHKHIMLILVLASIILIGGQPLLSVEIGDPATNVCPARTTTNASVNGTNIDGTNIDTPNDNMDYVSTRFFVMLFLNVVASFFDGNCVSMADTGVIQRLYSATTKKNFGWNRFFGSVGFSVGSFLSGLASDLFPILNINCFTGAICVYLCFCLGILISSRFLYLDKSKLNLMNRGADKENQQKGKVNIRKKVFKILKSVEVIMFFLTVFIVGIFLGVSDSFTGLRLKELEASSTLVGLTFSVAAISCFPFIIFSLQVISFLGGAWNTIIICCFSYVIRFISFSYIQNPWLALPINALQSLGSGLVIVTFILYVENVSEPNIYTTMISIYNGTFFGLGYIAANVIGGQIFHRYNGEILFASFGILAGVWTIILIFFKISQKIFRKKTVSAPTPKEITVVRVEQITKLEQTVIDRKKLWIIPQIPCQLT